MARPPRAFVEGIFHLTAHGSDVRHLFLMDDDRKSFLDRLAGVVHRFDLGLVMYALLGNHYHAVVSTPGGRISEALQQLHTWYARRHNWRRGRTAHLFRAHFFAREIRADADLISVCRYVANNPVEAGLSPTAVDWPWSSAAATAGLSAAAIPLEESPIRAALGDAEAWRANFRALIEETPKPAGRRRAPSC